ncbi:PilZ domain-containing protein [bacterium]|nr:MAG: PilZ domain-containing protein [bacterium]
MHERRRDERHDRKLEFKVGKGGEFLKATSVNISTRGISCVVSGEVPAMNKLRVSIGLPSGGEARLLECDGVVVRSEPCEGGYSIAIYFLNIDRDGAALIKEYLESTK